MIFQRSILREKITVSAVILLTLLTIILVLFLVRGLRDAAGGTIAVEGIVKLMFITTLRYFPLIVVVSTITGIIVTVTRLYQDSEMVVWQASGLSDLNLLRSIFMLVAPMCVFLFFMNMVLGPWGNKQLLQYRNQSGVSELSLVKGGVFHSAQQGKRVLFVQDVMKSSPPVFKNIFVVQNLKDQTVVLTAQQATLSNAYDNRTFLVMQDGRQYQDLHTKASMQSMGYDHYGFSIDEFTGIKSSDIMTKPVGSMSIMELWSKKDPAALAETYRRISDSIMIVPMALLAFVFGYVRPRSSGRAFGVISGLVLFMLYLNFIKFGEARVEVGRWSYWFALTFVHGSAFLLAFLAVWYRQNAWRIALPAFLRRH